MTKPRTMSMAIKRTEQQRHELTLEMRQYRHRALSAQQQLEQLVSYAQGTQNNFLMHAQRALHPALLHQHHQFMARLDDAIARQRAVVGDITLQIQACQTRLTASEQRAKVLQTWREQSLHRTAVHEARVAQKNDDEMARRGLPPAMRLYEERL